jgi:xylulokinase
MIVGIDVGTQSLKAVVLDEGLDICGEAATAYQPAFPKPGWAEQAPAVWESALAPTINQALKAAHVAPDRVKALGIGGQLDGCIAVGGDGLPVHPCLIWMDRRAQDEIAGLPAIEIRNRTGVILDPSHMAAKIKWLKRHITAARTGCVFHQPVSYLVCRLTGNHVMDHGLASTSMLYSLSARTFDSWLLDLFGIETAELPALADAADVAGALSADGSRLTGLAAGIPVAVGTGDDFSTPLGAGAVSPGRLVCVLGTAEVVGAVHPTAIVDQGGLVETHAFAGETYYIENPGWLSGGALAWFNQVFGLDDFRQLDDLADSAPPGCDGLTFLPGLSGTMAPEWIASARGCFYGLTPAHGTAHMARAMLEGPAFAMRDVMERLNAMGVQTRSILVLGGGANSSTWTKIRSDLAGLPVEVPLTVDTAPVGSALLAAVAAGIQPDLMTATQNVGGVRHTVQPDPTVKPAYDDAYTAYRRLFDCLRPMFR